MRLCDSYSSRFGASGLFLFVVNVGALIFRIGFWGPLYYNSNKEPPKIV